MTTPTTVPSQTLPHPPNSVRIPDRFMKRWKPFVNGVTLIDELSFSYYFHQKTVNQVFHFVSILIIHTCMIILLSMIYTVEHVSVLGLTFYIPYSILLLLLEYMSGFMYIIWFSFWIFMSPYMVQDTGDSYAIPIICMVLLLGLLLLQLVGHVLIEHRMPAFRAFELCFTTPCLLMIRFLVAAGFLKDVWEEIKVRSSQWQTWKQHTFCEEKNYIVI